MVDDRRHLEEMEILIPGPFVVLQGNTGDGLSNTIDGLLPIFRTRRTVSRTARRRGGGRQSTSVSDRAMLPNENNSTNAIIIDSQSTSTSPASSLSSPEEEEFQHVERSTAAGIVNGPRYAVTAGVVAASAAAEINESNNRNTDGNVSSSSDEFVVVTDDGDNDNAHSDQQQQLTEEDLTAIEEWKNSRRQNELQQRNDWEESLYQVPSEIKLNHAMMTRSPSANPNNDPQSMSWWQRNGEVAILRELPRKLRDGSVAVDRIGTLPPGLSTIANDLIELNSTTFLRITSAQGRLQRTSATLISTNSSVPPITSNRQRSFALGGVGIIQMIKVETKEGRTGYACLSLDGYPLLAPGLPDVYVNPGAPNRQDGLGSSHANGSWIWRVTCPSGAFVREGLDLRTRHIRTLPYGSLVRVTRRCINDQGLSRLRTSGCFDVQNLRTERGLQTSTVGGTSDSNAMEVSRVQVDGWCSELLNPLSGLRGIVAQPLPFPVPAIYRVTLTMGAVIRKDVELSSPQIGLAPFGSTVKITARAFSEHPVDKCIERLKLAGNGGWISVRLNLPPPRDDLVVELVRVDPDFDPENPGLYHLNAQRAVRAERERERAEQHPSDLSSIDENDLSHDMDMDDDGYNDNKQQCTIAQNGSSNKDNVSKCVVCLTSERNATIVHGETGHIVCCLVCARILKARGDKCPVCRDDIEKIIQHFYA